MKLLKLMKQKESEMEISTMNAENDNLIVCHVYTLF